MTEFLPQGDSAQPVQAVQPPAVQSPAVQSPPMQPPPMQPPSTWANNTPAEALPQNAAYPTPYAQAPLPKRKGMPWWVWLIIGGVVLFGAVFAIVVVLVVQQLNQGHSPDYTGAPIAPTEQVETPAPTATGEALEPTGGNEVISESGAVAYVLPEAWVDAHDYMDLSAMEDPLLAGQNLVGAHFTGEPGSDTPQFVVVIESAPSLSNGGTFDDQLDQFLVGFANSVPSVSELARTPITTASGLEGLQGDFTATNDGVDAAIRVTILGNGNRLVFVQWISYSGPIDDAAYNAFVDSLRIDP